MDIYQILRVSLTADKNELQAKYTRMLDSYQLVVSFADDPDVVKVAKLKLEQLIQAGQKEGLLTEATEGSDLVTPQQDIFAIKLALNSSRANPSTLRSNNISGKIDALPDSAEKHYLKAVVTLKLDRSLTGFQSALRELHQAVKLDSSSSAYSSLLDAIAEQVKEYEQNQRQAAEAAERDRQERERRSQAAINNAQRRNFQNSNSSCGGIFAVGCFLCCGCSCCTSLCNTCC